MIFVLIFDASEAFNLAVLRTPFFFSRIRSRTSLRPKEASEAFRHAIAGGKAGGTPGRVSFTFPEPSYRPAPDAAGRARPRHTALTSAGRYSPPSPPPNPSRPAASREDLPSPPPPRGTAALVAPEERRREGGTAALLAVDV